MKMRAKSTTVLRYKCKRCGWSFTTNEAFEGHREACRGKGDGG